MDILGAVDFDELIVKGVSDALAGSYSPLLAAGICLVVWCVKSFGKVISPTVGRVVSSDPGGVVLAFVAAFGVALGSQGVISVAAIVLAAKTAFWAIGGYSVFKKLLLPLVKVVTGDSSVDIQTQATKQAVVSSKEDAKIDAKKLLDGIK